MNSRASSLPGKRNAPDLNTLGHIQMLGRYEIPMKFCLRSIRFAHVAPVISREPNVQSGNVCWGILVSAPPLALAGLLPKSIKRLLISWMPSWRRGWRTYFPLYVVRWSKHRNVKSSNGLHAYVIRLNLLKKRNAPHRAISLMI